MVRQDGTSGIVGLRYANPTYSNYESLYLPSPLLTKEGNKKTLDPRLKMSRMTERDKQIPSFDRLRIGARSFALLRTSSE